MKYLLLATWLLLSACNTSSLEGNSNPSNKNVVLIKAVTEGTSLSSLVEQSFAQSKTPILYFHASWCRPCVEFKKALKDKRLVKVFENATLIGVDVDVNPQELGFQYNIKAVPTFIHLDKEAKAIASITSAEWAENTPENIAPVMERLINQPAHYNQ